MEHEDSNIVCMLHLLRQSRNKIRTLQIQVILRWILKALWRNSDYCMAQLKKNKIKMKKLTTRKRIIIAIASLCIVLTSRIHFLKICNINRWKQQQQQRVEQVRFSVNTDGVGIKLFEFVVLTFRIKVCFQICYRK